MRLAWMLARKLSPALTGLSAALGCTVTEPLLHISECSLHAILPLFSADEAHAPVRLSLETSAATVACCAAQLNDLRSLLVPPGAGSKDAVAEQLDEALRLQERQAQVIAHLLAVNDELETSNGELRTANVALSAALERHVAVVSTLAAENAVMLEHAQEERERL